MKWCVVGANGNMGNRHFRALTKHIRHWSTVDIGDEIPKAYGYVIATPTETHFDIICNVVSEFRPKIIVCEKPCCLNLNECADAVSLCESSGTELIVSYQRRMDPLLCQLQSMGADIRVDCLEDFTHLCHAYDMKNWYGPTCAVTTSTETKTGRALEVYYKRKIIPRALDYALDEFYRRISNNKSKNLCLGKQALYPHIINEYTCN